MCRRCFSQHWLGGVAIAHFFSKPYILLFNPLQSELFRGRGGIRKSPSKSPSKTLSKSIPVLILVSIGNNSQARRFYPQPCQQEILNSRRQGGRDAQMRFGHFSRPFWGKLVDVSALRFEHGELLILPTASSTASVSQSICAVAAVKAYF